MTELNTLSGSYVAIRQRRHRQREKRGRRVLLVEIKFNDLVEALLLAGHIDEAAALDDRNVAICAGLILDEWARRWMTR